MHPAIEPVPSPVQVLETLGPGTAAIITAARQRDAGAPLLEPDNLVRLIVRAIDTGDLAVARAVSDAALQIHPDHPSLLHAGSRALERHGDAASARARATRCAALEGRDDWRRAAAIAGCRALVARLPSP